MARKPGGPGGAPPPSGKKPAKQSPRACFLWAEGQQESGGNYDAVNPGSGALGRWQVMPSNLPGWLAASGLPQMTDTEYLHNPNAQDQLAWTILGGDYDKYGPRGAAAVWYSGQPDYNATYGDPPVYQYVNDVIQLMAACPNTAGGKTSLPTGGYATPQTVGVPPVPKPGPEDWSSHIIGSTLHFKSAANDFASRARHVATIKL
jgi:Transglycosylase SLT domain